MSKQLDLAVVFNKFIGLEIQAPENTHCDPVILQAASEAQKNGYDLRVIFGGYGYRADAVANRVNMHARQEAGKWHIRGKMDLG